MRHPLGIHLLLALGFLWPASIHGQGFNRQLNLKLNELKGVSEALRAWENIGTKEIGSPGLEATSRWLDSNYRSMGYEVFQDHFEDRGIPLHNLIIEKRSADSAADWLLLTAHYDTRTGSGTNDNGSGVVACMEIARLLTEVETRINVRIIHFSGEEFGLTGSRHYVNHTLRETTDEVLLVFNLDQLGGTAGSADNGLIYTERDEDSPVKNNASSDSLTKILYHITGTYSSLQAVFSRAFGSDYVPFQQAGYVINGLYQYSAYPFYHTSEDKLENMDTTALNQVVRAAAAYVLYLAGPAAYTLHSEEIPRFVRRRVYPNPASDKIRIEGHWERIQIRDNYGRLVWQTDEPRRELSIRELPASYYLIELYHGKQTVEYMPLLIVR